jgi:hypothetical protein
MLMHGSRQIGHDGASYTVTRLGTGSADELVSAVEVLARGQIDLSGLVASTPSGPGTFQLAIAGGTGSYSGARGYATVVPGSAPTITIHLTPWPAPGRARPSPARARPANPSGNVAATPAAPRLARLPGL